MGRKCGLKVPPPVATALGTGASVSDVFRPGGGRIVLMIQIGASLLRDKLGVFSDWKKVGVKDADPFDVQE